MAIPKFFSEKKSDFIFQQQIFELQFKAFLKCLVFFHFHLNILSVHFQTFTRKEIYKNSPISLQSENTVIECYPWYLP